MTEQEVSIHGRKDSIIISQYYLYTSFHIENYHYSKLLLLLILLILSLLLLLLLLLSVVVVLLLLLLQDLLSIL